MKILLKRQFENVFIMEQNNISKKTKNTEVYGVFCNENCNFFSFYFSKIISCFSFLKHNFCLFNSLQNWFQ